MADTAGNSAAPGPRPWPLDCITAPYRPPPIALVPSWLYDDLRREGVIRDDGTIQPYARG